MNLQQDFITIKLKEAKEMTDGGVYIPQSSPSPFRTGTVIATSDMCFKEGNYIDTPVEVGDVVTIHASAGMPYKDGLHLIQFGNVIEIEYRDAGETV